MVAHRYWRFCPLKGNVGGDGFIMMNRLRAYDAAGSTDYMQTGTVTSSAVQDGLLANLLDADNNSYAQFNAYPIHIQLDMGSGNDIELDHFVFNGGGAGGYEGRSPGVVAIQGSDDGITFTTYSIWYNRTDSGLNYTVGRTVAIPAYGGTPEWWGITIDYTDRGFMSVTALQMFDDAGSSTNLALGVSNPTAVDWYSGSYTPAKAFDADINSFWSSGSNVKPGFLFCQLPAAAVIEKIAITGRNDDLGADDAPQGGMVIYSEDGINFVPYWTYTMTGWADNADTKTADNPDPGTIGGGGGGPSGPTRRRLAVVVC